jgi:alkanesulfonate monooxygenase SsuD/methylene tetrahydromethanopterin reductase-like flavin-dependent oxidoreductase (luciferase family)
MAIPIGPLRGLVETYRKSWRAAGHPGNGTVMVAFHMFCHADAAAARDIARGPFEAYFRALGESAGEWTTGASSKDYKGYDRSMAKLKAFTLDSQIESGGAWIGTPAEIRDSVARCIEAIGPFEHASLQINFANIDVEAARASLRLFAREVMPAFA